MKIKDFRDINVNKRCFIVGTGPSINHINFKLIQNEIIFGVNTLYRGLKKFNIECKYWGVSDAIIWKNHKEQIRKLNIPTFISSPAHNPSPTKNEFNINMIGRMYESGKFSTDITKGIYNGDTVVIDVCLQVSYYMGFNKVYLIGCDCDYSKGHRFDGLPSDSPNTPAINGDMSRIFKSYKICKEIYESSGKKIINCTIGGKLEIFERLSLEEVIKYG